LVEVLFTAPTLSGCLRHPWKPRSSYPREWGFNYSRDITNWLLSARLFLDHTDARLSRTYGSASRERKSYRALTHRAWDSSFGYRLAYELRNYVQHAGFPAIRISAHATNPPGPRSDVEINFQRDQLLERHKYWKASVRDEIAGRTSEFEVLSAMNEAARAFLDLAARTAALEFPYQRVAIVEMDDLLARFGTSEGEPAVFEFKDWSNDEDRQFTPVQVPVDLVAWYKAVAALDLEDDYVLGMNIVEKMLSQVRGYQRLTESEDDAQ
jgi:hypothetical protein